MLWGFAQEARQHDEQVNAKGRVAKYRNTPTCQDQAVPDQNPQSGGSAKSVQAFDSR